MALALKIGKCNLIGNYRENNEDSVDAKQFPDLTEARRDWEERYRSWLAYV